ncbi:MAG: hypothetical protein RLZZ210_427 [Pseudomonadota bacterium]|jgi:general secretion pathway protein N
MIKATKDLLRHLKWFLPLLIIVSTIVIMNIPASYLVDKLEKASGYRLRMMNTTGTVWNGSAYIGLSYGKPDKLPITLPTPVTWSISISNILNLNINVKHKNIAKPFKIYPFKKAISDLYIEDLPIDFFDGLEGPLSSLDLGGNIQVHIPETSIGNIENIPLDITFTEIYRKEDPNLILGSYSIKSGNEDNRFDVSTISGVLNISGSGTLKPFSFSGEAKPDEIFASRLSPFLHTIGYEKEGKTVIEF